MNVENWKSDLEAALARKAGVASLDRIFIVDDHPVFREGMRLLLAKEPGLCVCGEAEDARQALRSIARIRPDLVLVDITLPGESGLQLIKKIRQFDREIKLLAVSMHDEAIYANRVLRAGGNGYIMKQQDPDEIVHAIRDILAGHIYVSEEVLARGGKTAGSPRHETKHRTPLFDELTDLELEILQYLGRRKSNSEIALLLHSEVETVTSACDQIRHKLKLKDTDALLRYAVNWLEPWLEATSALSPRKTRARGTATKTLPEHRSN